MKGVGMNPKGFWSYARGDDDHLDGVLTNLRKRIAGEVSMLLGHDVDIFQDIYDLRTGDRWEDKLRAGITATTFLIPVLTPRFFNRPWCREEVLTYLRLCKDKGIEPRIFPIRFVDYDNDNDCDVRAALKPFQYKSFTQWRFESDPTARARLENDFAKDVKDRLKADLPARAALPAKSSQVTESAPATVSEPASAKAPPPVRYKTHVVDPKPRRGDFHRIADAIKAANPGDRIVIREGTYRETLRLSKPLQLIGEGDRDRIVVVSAKGNAVLLCEAPMARVRGLCFRRKSGQKGVGLWVTGGEAEFDDCAFESRSLACVAIEGVGTRPTFRRCAMRNGAEGGLIIYDGAEPLIEECTMEANQFAGVGVKGEGTRPVLRRCVARDGMQVGFLFQSDAVGVLEDCEATGNAYSGVEISKAAMPKLLDCKLRGNKQAGLFVNAAGKGDISDCEIDDNGGAGVSIVFGGSPSISNCRIRCNILAAVWIQDASGGGTFRENDLRGNASGAWRIAEGAKVTREGNKE